MVAPDKILELVDRFSFNHSSYRATRYNETQVRREFIDPMFKVLGWDIDNENGYAEAYKEVIHEDAIKIGGQTKAPDYSFRIGGTRKFFLEAKKPAVNVREEMPPAFQLRRYAWSAKLPLSILTDFEELAVYDCRVKPNHTDRASTARIQYLTFRDYADRWDDIVSVFSREAILKGSFDKYANDSKGKRGTAEVDNTFLKEIENWRELLAKNIALRNPALTQRELNTAVQKTIDRIIFLRICEDRGIEPYDTLGGLQKGAGIYARLGYLFQRADDRYNSGLFHFKRERNRPEEADTFTLGLKIDDKPLKEILKGLYYPASPYEFSVLPADILGQVYEQFLGKVIVLDDRHKATVEEKPEVKKAGGVYYTPTYIVDYIVQNTVGRLLEGKTPNQISAKGKTPPLRVLDPACGSGSFLIGAYQHLLDWHLAWYIANDPEKYAKGRSPRLYQGKAQAWRLTTDERKRILLTHIYGVDIDVQAVEVTKLSLLLKMLEGENNDTLEAQTKLFQERVLPDLESNIKSGNSLIGSDFYSNAQINIFDEAERYRINVFDWEDEFAQVFADGGFDAVIGNPPWGSAISKAEKQYLLSHYVNKRGEAESHLYFIEKGIRLLTQNGILGYITPNTWITVKSSEQTREFLLKNSAFLEVAQLSKHIFKHAPDVVPLLMFLGRNPETVNEVVVKTTGEPKINQTNFGSAFSTSQIAQQIWTQLPGCTVNLYATPTVLKLLTKIKDQGDRLGSVSSVVYGIKTGDNGKFLSKGFTEKHTKKALKTGELKRYELQWKGFCLQWGKELAGYRESTLEVPKIVVQYIRKLSLETRLISALDEEGIYYPLNNYSYILAKDERYPLKYLLGIFNSSLINYYYANTFVDYNIKPAYLKELPIKTGSKQQKEKIINLVDAMLIAAKKLQTANTSQDKKSLERHMKILDQQLNQLVYGLYSLTPEEISFVEGRNVRTFNKITAQFGATTKMAVEFAPSIAGDIQSHVGEA